MTKAALMVVLVMGCGSVTAKSVDGADGSQGATGGAGGELGGRDGQLGTGGAGGELGGRGDDAGLATTGPCAGLCSNPTALTLTPHVPLVLSDRPGACYAVSISAAGYTPELSCSPPTEAIEINGRALKGCTTASSGSVAGYPDANCVVFLANAPSTGTVTLQ